MDSFRGNEPAKKKLGYSTYVWCENCDFRDDIELELGELIARTPCPECGNRTLERAMPSVGHRRSY
jgi:predicted RNA-binding Zn-ribbon protein involved in translation (DUF1610 family)